MTTEQLRYFVLVAENGSYSKTARECYISQSSVSKQIRAFERELGCTLFDRSRRRVRLTEDWKLPVSSIEKYARTI